MSPSSGKSRNDQFLDTLADELNDIPASELLEGCSPEEALQLAQRLVMSSHEEAGRRWVLTHEITRHGESLRVTMLVGPRSTLGECLLDGAVLGLTVKNVCDPGAVVDLGYGSGALLHITDLPWSTVRAAREVVKPGDQLSMRILAMKHVRIDGDPPVALRLDPWDNFSGVTAAAPELSADGSTLLATLEEGAQVRGTVKYLTQDGAFVDLGGIDGMLHIRDMAWTRITHPSEIVKVGDEIDVRILKVDRERSRVSLGLKQLRSDPWSNIPNRYPPQTRLFGKVKAMSDAGVVWVEIEDGIEGVVRVWDLDWTRINCNPAKVLQIGQEVEVMVLEIDAERRRIYLGLKQCRPNPWQGLAHRYKRGDRVSGLIYSISDLGLALRLPDNIDALVHPSDIAWGADGAEAMHNYQQGQQVEARVLWIDAEVGHLRLGIKQLTPDPFPAYVAQNPRGALVTGRVKEVDARGAVIDLGNGIQGRVPPAELRRDRFTDARIALQVGEAIEAMLTGVDHLSRTISLSLRDPLEDTESVRT